MFRIVDDGTLDTVVRCMVCGVEQRFNLDEFVDDDAGIEEALLMAREEHNCEEDDE